MSALQEDELVKCKSFFFMQLFHISVDHLKYNPIDLTFYFQARSQLLMDLEYNKQGILQRFYQLWLYLSDRNECACNQSFFSKLKAKFEEKQKKSFNMKSVREDIKFFPKQTLLQYFAIFKQVSIQMFPVKLK